MISKFIPRFSVSWIKFVLQRQERTVSDCVRLQFGDFFQTCGTRKDLLIAVVHYIKRRHHSQKN